MLNIMNKDFENRLIGSVSNQILRLTIYPTEQCNFRCSYCYQYYKNSKMPEEIINGLILFLKERMKDLKMIHINWFGGEPLLARDIIKKVSKSIDIASRENNIKYIGNMTTNGYLLEENVFKELTDLGIKTFQITLDGEAEIHDNNRKLLNGRGTFEKIWNNLEQIRKSDIDGNIRIRLHYNNENYKNLIPLILKIKDELLFDDRFEIYFRPIEKFGGKNDNNIISVPYEKQKEISNYLKSFIKKDSSIYNRFDNYICYAAQLNSFVIRANGQIQKCDLALDLEENNIGNLNADGTIELDREKFLMWSKGLETKDEKMLSCPYYYHFKKGKTI